MHMLNDLSVVPSRHVLGGMVWFKDSDIVLVDLRVKFIENSVEVRSRLTGCQFFSHED